MWSSPRVRWRGRRGSGWPDGDVSVLDVQRPGAGKTRTVAAMQATPRRFLARGGRGGRGGGEGGVGSLRGEAEIAGVAAGGDATVAGRSISIPINGRVPARLARRGGSGRRG